MLDMTNIIWKSEYDDSVVQILKIRDECLTYRNINTDICDDISIDLFCAQFTAIGEKSS